jgi:hypothetical protein
MAFVGPFRHDLAVEQARLEIVQRQHAGAVRQGDATHG